MSPSIMAASPKELFYIGSAILIGAVVCHTILLRLQKRFRASLMLTSTTSTCHGLRYFDDEEVSKDISSFSDEKHVSDEKIPAKLRPASTRGLITSLPSYQDRSAQKSSWHTEKKHQVLHQVIVQAHEANRRSTYLGASTYDKKSPSASLFGWQRPVGQPSIHLGEIASIKVSPSKDQDVTMQLELHPDDARVVMESGWGQAAGTGDSLPERALNKLTGVAARRGQKGISVLLSTPRDEAEIETITRQVLHASVWWMAGIDDEEDV